MNIQKYFTIGTDEWKKTVKWSILLGVMLGLIAGIIIASRM